MRQLQKEIKENKQKENSMYNCINGDPKGLKALLISSSNQVDDIISDHELALRKAQLSGSSLLSLSTLLFSPGSARLVGVNRR